MHNAAVRLVSHNGLLTHAAALLDRAVEAVAATLLVVEIVNLLAGVIARYAFHAPLVWSDELAGVVFLWLAMMGAVIAVARGGHMRFSGLLQMAGPRWRELLEGTASAVTAGLPLLLIGPALDYFDDESYVTLPNLGIPSSVKAASLLAGMALIVATLLLRPRSVRGWIALGIGGALVACVGAVLWLAAPALVAIGNYNLLIFFLGLVGAAIAIGVPIGFAFGITSVAYLLSVTDTPLSIVLNRLAEGMSQSLLLAIPTFVFLGLLIEITGLARSMVDLLVALLGGVRGGLNYVLLGAMILVSGISGSKAADMAAVAPALLPEMRRRGIDPADTVALLAASAAMADTIPPSLVLITLGSVTGISIAALFAAGLIPALVLAAALALVAAVRARREPTPSQRGIDPGRLLRAFARAIPALLLPFFIRFAVVAGIATATEVSTLGIAYAGITGLTIYRPVQWRLIGPILLETACLSGAILFVIGTAGAMAWCLAQSGFSADLVAAMTRVPGGAGGFLAVTIVAFVLLGNVLEGIPAILLFAPLLLPVSHSLGIADVHYAMVIVIAMSIGLFAPPFGIGFYTACSIGRVEPDAVLPHMWRYLAALAAALAAIAALPFLSTAFT